MTQPDHSRSILVYSVGQFGDTLVNLPAIWAIRDSNPGAHLVLLTDSHPNNTSYVSAWDVLEPTQWIDEVYFYVPTRGTLVARLRQMKGLIDYLSRFDFMKVYNFSRRTSKLSIIRDRVFFSIFAKSKIYKAKHLTKYPIPTDKSGNHTSILPHWKQSIDLVAGKDSIENFSLPIRHEFEEEWIRSGVMGTQESGAERFVVFAPGSKMPAKEWPISYFEDLGAQVLANYPDVFIAIVGGKSEYVLGETLAVSLGERSRNFAGLLSIYGTAALMRESLAFVGIDSGNMHLAGLVGLPSVAIFSARDHRGLWEPFGSGHKIVRRDLACSGCMLTECIIEDMKCLKTIEVEEVYSLLEKLLVL